MLESKQSPSVPRDAAEANSAMGIALNIRHAPYIAIISNRTRSLQWTKPFNELETINRCRAHQWLAAVHSYVRTYSYSLAFVSIHLFVLSLRVCLSSAIARCDCSLCMWIFCVSRWALKAHMPLLQSESIATDLLVDRWAYAVIFALRVFFSQKILGMHPHENILWLARFCVHRYVRVTYAMVWLHWRNVNESNIL